MTIFGIEPREPMVGEPARGQASAKLDDPFTTFIRKSCNQKKHWWEKIINRN